MDVLEGEFGVAGGAGEAADAPGLVEGGDHCRDQERGIINHTFHLAIT